MRKIGAEGVMLMLLTKMGAVQLLTFRKAKVNMLFNNPNLFWLHFVNHWRTKCKAGNHLVIRYKSLFLHAQASLITLQNVNLLFYIMSNPVDKM